MIAGSALMSLLIQLIIGGLILYVIWWGLSKIGLPEPFNKIAMVIVVLVTVVFLINILMGLGGRPLISWR